ncbi:hypothetical protein [Citrobacter amalonaticus]|uniref:hypothetical protein n=1 Tax=Citrobacter amalonaticus TaxID=35703 RepID=UPI0005C80CF0|nr:hypothetical protein [Citrobacter amalonaticus]
MKDINNSIKPILRKRYPRGCKFKELRMSACGDDLFRVELLTHDEELINLHTYKGMPGALGGFEDVSLLNVSEVEAAFSGYTH